MSKSLTLSNGLNLARSSGIAQSQIVRPTDSIWFAITAVSFIASRAVWTVIGARSRTATMPQGEQNGSSWTFAFCLQVGPRSSLFPPGLAGLLITDTERLSLAG